MKRSKEQRLAVAAIRILDEVGPSLDMDTFANHCGTSCCLAGHAVLPMGKTAPRKGMSPIQERLIADLAGDFTDNFTNRSASWLFSPVWSNDRKQCATRVLMFLENDKGAPAEFETRPGDQGPKGVKDYPVPRNLRARLMKFVPADLKESLSK
jgi:hypothetical protein